MNSHGFELNVKLLKNKTHRSNISPPEPEVKTGLFEITTTTLRMITWAPDIETNPIDITTNHFNLNN